MPIHGTVEKRDFLLYITRFTGLKIGPPPLPTGPLIGILMKKSKLNLLILLLVSALGSACNPASEKSPDRFRIGLSQCTGDSKWRQATLEGVNRELTFHPGSELIYKNAGDNSALQVRQIRELMNEKIDVLLVSPNEAEPLTAIVEEVYQKGIPVVILDRRILSDQYTAFVGADNFEIGYMAGNYLVNSYRPESNVIELVGLQGSTSSVERKHGFEAALRNNPKIKISKSLHGNWLEKTAFDKLWRIRHELRAGDIVFAQNDPMALGAYQVYQKMGIEKETVFIGVDGLGGPGGGIELVADKKLKATLLNPTGGEEAVQIAFRILNKEPFQKENTLSTVVIDSTNVRIMKLQTEKISAQQRDILKQSEILLQQQRIHENQTLIIQIFIAALLLVVTLGSVAAIALRNNRKINRQLSVQNTEILDQKNQLEEMTERAKQAADAKFNFFTAISHEFRTPLTLILGPLEDLLATEKFSNTAQNSLQVVHKNALRMLRLINQLMDFRKVEEQKMKLRVAENDLVRFVREIVHSFQVIARKKAVSFFVNTRFEHLPLWFDNDMIDKVLFNLLSNAFKFTPDHGIISIAIDKSPDGKYAVLQVEDSGIGMTPDEINHAFDLFYQGNTQKIKGTGLGLSLSKELVALHHGSIEIKSKKGEGACFEVRLPLGKDHFASSEVDWSGVDTTVSCEEIDLLSLEFDSPTLAPSPAPDASREHSILVIEDDPEVRSFLRTRLSRTYEVHEADNGKTGIAMAHELIPDLIISDIVLPGKDGLQVTEMIKQDLRTSHIPLVLLTAKSSMEEQIAGAKMLADAYVTKPFNAEHLSETIKNLLKSRIQLREHYTSELWSRSKPTFANKMDRKFVSAFTAVVENNIANESFTIDDICKEMGVSRVQLYRKAKTLLGYRINDYILTIRLQKAKFLLSTDDSPISEIAAKVGFSSQAYFATVFRSRFSMTPTDYRESLSR